MGDPIFLLTDFGFVHIAFNNANFFPFFILLSIDENFRKCYN